MSVIIGIINAVFLYIVALLISLIFTGLTAMAFLYLAPSICHDMMSLLDQPRGRFPALIFLIIFVGWAFTIGGNAFSSIRESIMDAE